MENELEENRKFLVDKIVSEVRFGFSDPETIVIDVLEQAEDEGWENDFSEDWIRKTVAAEHKKRKEESKSWQHPTQTEKLHTAFDKLRKEKIVALHFAGYTQSDSLYDVEEIVQQLKGKGIQHQGHCFYHEQDLERAIGEEPGELYLGFYGADSKDEPAAIAAGNKIKQVLEAEGFGVVWSGDLGTRIAIKPFTWQHVYTNDRDLEKWQDERVLDLMK